MNNTEVKQLGDAVVSEVKKQLRKMAHKLVDEALDALLGRQSGGRRRKSR